MKRNQRSADTEASKISIRFTAAQRAVIAERASAEGKSFSDYIRTAALGDSATYGLHDVRIRLEEMESSFGYLALMMEQIQASLAELSVAMLYRLPDPTGDEQERRGKVTKAMELMNRALDNAAKVVAQVHVASEQSQPRDPMRIAEIREWSERISHQDKGGET